MPSEKQLLGFLSRRTSYPHRPRRVRLIHTHSAVVALAPPFVYKVKKPVDFGFLDFSTLAKRGHFCRREVVLNRRLSPDLYLGVVPIYRAKGKLSFSGPGSIVEYSVKMRHLDERYFLNKLLRRGKVRRQQIDRIVKRLAPFYLDQGPGQRLGAWGKPQKLKLNTDENFRQTRPLVGRVFSSAAFAALRHFFRRVYATRARLLHSRARQGWIRDCHGDLHLEHIHLTGRELHIYDCIEFNDRLRYIDVASDLAFLAMDFDFIGRPDLSRYFLSRMQASLQDTGLYDLMSFYKSYRAHVRAKVECLQASSRTDAGREGCLDRARRYFRLALQYAMAGSEPLVLVVMGQVASGKSTLAAALGAELGWEVFSSDVIRKAQARLPILKRASSAQRKKLYASRATDRVYQRLSALALSSARAGHGVILDATFSRAKHRMNLAQQLRARGIPFRFIEVGANKRTILYRLRLRDGRRVQVSDARLEDYPMLMARYERPTELARGELLRARTDQAGQATLENVMKDLIEAQLKNQRQGGMRPVVPGASQARDGPHGA